MGEEFRESAGGPLGETPDNYLFGFMQPSQKEQGPHPPSRFEPGGNVPILHPLARVLASM